MDGEDEDKDEDEEAIRLRAGKGVSCVDRHSNKLERMKKELLKVASSIQHCY